MLNVILATVGTKKALWGVTGGFVVAIVLTPELMLQLGALLAIVFTGIVNIMNARTSAKKQDVLQAQNAEIAVKVDGTAHAAKAQIDLLQQQVTMLLADQAAKKEIASALATAAAKTPTP